MEFPMLNPSERFETSSQPFTAAGTATSSVGPDEVLVADARGGLSPVQMVEQKLLDVLGSGHPGLFRQATGRMGNIRMMPGQ